MDLKLRGKNVLIAGASRGIGLATAFLPKSDPAPFMTGANLIIDGGFTKRIQF